jgi:fatty acid desaturase
MGFVGVAAVCFAALQISELPLLTKPLLGLVLGVCFGGLGFFAHELFHGSIVRNRRVQDILGFFCFMPFFISPTFWRHWHNRLHHGKTQSLISDPDAFPTLRIYRNSTFMKFMFPFTPGSGHKRSYLYFFFWFSFHVFVAQTYLRFRNSIFVDMNQRRVSLEFGAQIVIWSTFLYFMGPQNLLWTFLVPLFAQNYFVMSYISTNHNLSPLTKLNDPLKNSLTVTNHRWLEWFHLNFGYHVEHHIYPSMSGIEVKKVHLLLKREFPDDFKYMKKSTAMRKLYQTARIYKNSKTLINPDTGKTFETL